MPIDTRQQKWLPLGLNPQDIATGFSGPVIPFPELGKVYAAEHHQFRCLQPPFHEQVSCLNKRPSYVAAAATEGPLKPSQKRFLVFDQSGNQTRLLQYGFPLQFPSYMAAEQGKILDPLNPEKGFSKDLGISEKILVHDVENSYNDEEESEMHEDTEEINALLYSDDEDDDDDDCESDDEVMSTGHSPFSTVVQQACNNKATEEELDETESTSDDDGPRPSKRQKLLDHSYRDSSPSPSFVGTKLEGLSDEKLPESKTGSGLSEEQSRKDKIHTAMRILESVVPGAKGKEALLLLDEAIDYLKSLKRNLLNNHW